MADWTNLPNTAVGVGGLPSGTTVTALRDNPIAIAEGSPGAVRLYGKAAVPRPQQTELAVATGLVASDNFELDPVHWTGDFFNVTATTSFQTAGTITSLLMSGTVRFRATQFASVGPIGTATTTIRLKKNGTILNTFAVAASSGPATNSAFRQVDVSVVPGDFFEWEVTVSGGGGSISGQIQLADNGYTRIGIPILTGDL